MHFGDDHLAREIQKELDPKKQKAMGRCVSGFTDEEWDKGMLRWDRGTRGMREDGSAEEFMLMICAVVKTQACEDASMLKYTQCSIRADDPKMPGAPMRQLLLDTGERELIEASPFDRIWGVGRKAEDVRREAGGDRKGWGQNLLGKCLMATRAKLRAMDEREERERLRKVKEGLGLS